MRAPPSTLILFASAVDQDPVANSPPESFAQTAQQVLMENFYSNQNATFQMEVTKGEMDLGYCDGWEGLECHRGLVSKVAYRRWALENFNVEYLPPTVAQLQIISCKQKFRLNARRFPQSLESLSLMANYIFGTVDTAGLPRRLRRFGLSSNKLTGPLHLVHLPPHMTHFNVVDNLIRQKTVVYHDVPENIDAILLKGGGNSIANIEPLYPEEAIDRPRVFSRRVKMYRRGYTR